MDEGLGGGSTREAVSSGWAGGQVRPTHATVVQHPSPLENSCGVWHTHSLLLKDLGMGVC